MSNLFTKKSPHSLTGLPTSTTYNMSKMPTIYDQYMHHVRHYVKTGRTATLHTTLSLGRLATGLCRSPTSPPSPGRPTPSTPALHRFHQFEDWTYLPYDIYKSRWWNIITAELRTSFCSPAPALMDNVMLLRLHNQASVLKIALLKVFRLVLSLHFLLLYKL